MKYVHVALVELHILAGEQQRTLPSLNLATINLTRTGLESNPGLRGVAPVTGRLNERTA